MDYLTEIASQSLLGTLFVVSLLVILYQNREIRALQDKRLEDWKTVLNIATGYFQNSQRTADMILAVVQGLDRRIEKL